MQSHQLARNLRLRLLLHVHVYECMCIARFAFERFGGNWCMYVRARVRVVCVHACVCAVSVLFLLCVRALGHWQKNRQMGRGACVGVCRAEMQFDLVCAWRGFSWWASGFAPSNLLETS